MHIQANCHLSFEALFLPLLVELFFLSFNITLIINHPQQLSQCNLYYWKMISCLSLYKGCELFEICDFGQTIFN